MKKIVLIEDVYFVINQMREAIEKELDRQEKAVGIMSDFNLGEKYILDELLRRLHCQMPPSRLKKGD